MKDKKNIGSTHWFSENHYICKNKIPCRNHWTKPRKQKFLDLKKWALTTIQSIHRNYGTQKVWPRGYPGPYIGYRNTPAAKRSTGESFSYRNFYRGRTIWQRAIRKKFPSFSDIIFSLWTWVLDVEENGDLKERMPNGTNCMRNGRDKVTGSSVRSLQWKSDTR